MTPAPVAYALVEPRHRCLGCGACCQGAKVAVQGRAEAARIRRLARTLGLERPPVDGDGWLARDGGACVFLDEAHRCRLHVAFGPEAKPAVCRQFPLVAVTTEDGLRVGVDPGSTAGWLHWRSGPTLPSRVELPPRRSHLPAGHARAEAALIGLARQPGMTIARLAAVLAGRPEHRTEALPEGFAGRLVRRLADPAWTRVLEAADCGPWQRAALRPLALAAAVWDEHRPPSWPAAGRESPPQRLDAYGCWALAAVLHLRLSTRVPLPQGVALLVVAGLVANAWANPTDAAFARASAAWLLLIRAAPFWQALLPSPAAMRWLATGRDDGDAAACHPGIVSPDTEPGIARRETRQGPGEEAEPSPAAPGGGHAPPPKEVTRR